MEQVLYEYHLNVGDYMLNLIPLAVGIGFLVMAIAAIVTRRRMGKWLLPRGVVPLGLSVAVLGIGLFVLVTVNMLSQHFYFCELLQRGEVYTVEGYVENYHPMPYEGHDSEHFEINGVYFEYSDYEIVNGYHTSASHGGVITKDGQHLKIKYVVDEFNGVPYHIILYIAQTDPIE